ncbi:MAG: hypothetical protein FWC75_00550 [Oscillospiraceae bacterium]|nr:hypothetical protein [Oscillospiraceae bacterium]
MKKVMIIGGGIAGFRMIPPGGFPPALISGQIAVQYLCAETGTEFVM